MITHQDFENIDIRVGRIVEVEDFSEVLTLGRPDENEEVMLLAPDKKVPLGGKMF